MKERPVCRGLLAAALLAAVTLSPPSHAADIGDPAAPLKIAEWVKGSPISLADAKGKKILVVEFWATWCGPCRTSIPHLTEIQKTFKDKGVVVIGVSDEESRVVKPFVEKMGDKMEYVVAVDDDGATSEGYMKAYGQNGIPHAFIVDQESRIVWHGHPMDGLDKALEQVVAGKMDLAAARKRSAVQSKLREYQQLLFAGRDDERTTALEKELVALDQELGGIMNGAKFDPQEMRRMVQFSRNLREYQQLLMAGDPADAPKIAALEKSLGENPPPGFNVAQFKQQFQAQKLFSDYMQEATGAADSAKLAPLAAQLEKMQGTGPEMLNQIAWTLLTEESIKKRDVPLALKLAKAAYEGSEGKNPSIVDTYARALFDSGKVDEAIRHQKKAIELCDDDDMRKEFEANLKTFEAKATNK